jgi:sugar lactone lactonase YvrE
MAPDLPVVVEGCSFLEGPRWHDGRLWLSDFFLGVVVSVDPPGVPRVEAEVPHGASGTGWLPDGRLLVVSMRDRRVLRREPDGTLVEHADLSHLAAGWCNDMVVDGHGRAYVGNFGYDLMAGEQPRPAPLIRVDPDGTATIASPDLRFPNGAVVLGDVLVVGETLGSRLSAFDIDADGCLGPRRDWAAWDPANGRVAPDGICADAEGAIWVADPRGDRAIRVREGGEIMQVVDAGTGVYACALGGADRRTLYLCVAPGHHERDRRPTREAKVLAVRVDVPGV